MTLLGATGFLGSEILKQALNLGISITCLSRQQRPSYVSSHVEWVQTDLRTDQLNPDDWNSVVVSAVMLPLLADRIEELQSSKFEIQRILAFSSSSVITKRHSTNGYDLDLVRALGSAENQLLSANFAVTILRPTLIYGGSGDRNVEVISEHVHRTKFFPLVGNGSGLRQPIHVSDLSALGIRLALLERTSQPVYNLGGGEILTFRAMVERIAKRDSKKVSFVFHYQWVIVTMMKVARCLIMMSKYVK